MAIYFVLYVVACGFVLGLLLLLLAWWQHHRGKNWGGAFLLGIPGVLLGVIFGIIWLIGWILMAVGIRW